MVRSPKHGSADISRSFRPSASARRQLAKGVGSERRESRREDGVRLSPPAFSPRNRQPFLDLADRCSFVVELLPEVAPTDGVPRWSMHREPPESLPQLAGGPSWKRTSALFGCTFTSTRSTGSPTKRTPSGNRPRGSRVRYASMTARFRSPIPHRPAVHEEKERLTGGPVQLRRAEKTVNAEVPVSGRDRGPGMETMGLEALRQPILQACRRRPLLGLLAPET